MGDAATPIAPSLALFAWLTPMLADAAPSTEKVETLRARKNGEAFPLAVLIKPAPLARVVDTASERTVYETEYSSEANDSAAVERRAGATAFGVLHSEPTNPPFTRGCFPSLLSLEPPDVVPKRAKRR